MNDFVPKSASKMSDPTTTLAQSSPSNSLFQPQATTELAVVSANTEKAPVAPTDQKVLNLAKTINLDDLRTIDDFGQNCGTNVTKASDALLQQVRSIDTNAVGLQLNNIVVKAKSLNFAGLEHKKSSIPLIGGFIDSFKLSKEKMLGQFDTVAQQIEKIVQEMSSARDNLASRINLLDGMFVDNTAEYHLLTQLIEAGEWRSAQITEVIAKQRLELETNRDPIFAQQIRDLDSAGVRLDQRIDSFRKLQTLALQTAPEIRMIQANSRLLMQKIKDMKDMGIPAWKKQISLALTQEDQKRIAELDSTVTNAINDFMKSNADSLNQNSVEIAKATQRGVLDLATLEHIQKSLFSAVEEVDRINAEGKQMREDAKVRMGAMQTELVDYFAKRGTINS